MADQNKPADAPQIETEAPTQMDPATAPAEGAAAPADGAAPAANAPQGMPLQSHALGMKAAQQSYAIGMPGIHYQGGGGAPANNNNNNGPKPGDETGASVALGKGAAIQSVFVGRGPANVGGAKPTSPAAAPAPAPAPEAGAQTAAVPDDEDGAKTALPIAMNNQGPTKLVCEPEKLVFKPPFNKPQVVNLKLTNMSKEIVVYKVMATVPQYYHIRGKQGVLKPNQTTAAIVRLEPLENPVAAKKEKHRVMVQTAVVGAPPAEIGQFWKTVDDTKNKVQFQNIKVKIQATEKKNETTVDEEALRPGAAAGSLIVEPETDLIFRGPFNEIVTSAIVVVNNTDKHMQIKMMVTNGESFRVRPNFCVINPRAMQVLACMVEPIKDLQGMIKKKNKFMISYAETETKDPSNEAFWNKKPTCQNYKLNASFTE